VGQGLLRFVGCFLFVHGVTLRYTNVVPKAVPAVSTQERWWVALSNMRRWFAVAFRGCLQRHCAWSVLVLCCAVVRAYKEEEKKMGTLQQENIERPDSMTTTGEPQQHSAIYYDEQLFAVAPYASNACKGCMRTCTSCRLCCGQLDL
jgi:hypothetical protein